MHFLFEESDLLNVPVECFYFNSETNQFPVRPHWHYYMEIIYMLNGTAQMHEGSKTYTLGQGEMIVFHPKKVHAIYPADDEPIGYAVLKLDINRMTMTSNYSPKLRSIFRFADHKNAAIRFTKEQTHLMNAEDIFHRCIMEKNAQKYGYDIVIHSEIYRLLIGILRCWQDNGFVIDGDVFDEDSRFDIDNITEYIDENLSHNIKVSEIAHKCGMSYSYFAKRFLEIYKKTCKAYIEEMRIFKVEEFLVFTDFDLTYISQECGFTDCSHMINSFKRVMGSTPRRYRVQHKSRISH